MNDLKKAEALEILLAEAVDMLEDVRQKFGLFEKQRYDGFRSLVDAHNSQFANANSWDDVR